MTSSPYRTQLFPSSGRALFSGLIWSPPRSGRADDDSAWIESANIQGQPPPQWLSRLYQYHPHHRFKPVHLRLWIRHRLPKSKLETENGPTNKDLAVRIPPNTLLRSTIHKATEMHLCRGHRAQWCHMTATTSGSTDRFRRWNPALPYRRVRSGARQFRGRSAFLRLSAPSRSQRESRRTLAALLARRHSGAGWWEAAALACHETAPLCTGIPLKTYRLGCCWKTLLGPRCHEVDVNPMPRLVTDSLPEFFRHVLPPDEPPFLVRPRTPHHDMYCTCWTLKQVWSRHRGPALPPKLCREKRGRHCPLLLGRQRFSLLRLHYVDSTSRGQAATASTGHSEKASYCANQVSILNWYSLSFLCNICVLIEA